MKLKKLVAMFIALVMVLGMTGMPASAEDATATALDQFAYDQDDANLTVTLTKYTGDATEVVVPGTYDIDGTDYAVIIDSATTFAENKSITSVKINDGVTFKDNTMQKLFYKCSALKNADLSETDTTGVTDMSYIFYECKKLETADVTGFDTSAVTTLANMFYYCAKVAITGFEDFNTSNVESIYRTFSDVGNTPVIDISGWDLSKVKNSGWCFQYTKATSVLLPDNLPIIGAGFFNNAEHIEGTSFTIPKGVKKIGYAHTFYNVGTTDFVEFKVAEGNENYVAIDGVLYSADGTEILGVPKGKTFPNDTYEILEGVTFIPELSFSQNRNIKKVILPNSYVMDEYVYLSDPRYITYNDRGNINEGSSLTIAFYYRTGITDYVVKDDNPRYVSIDGIIYDKDMTTVLAVPLRYDRVIDVPENVTTWNTYVLWPNDVPTSTRNTPLQFMVNCEGVNIPSTLTNIAEDQIEVMNTLVSWTNEGKTSSMEEFNESGPFEFEITVASGNPVYRVNTEGMIEQYAITENDITLSEDFYAYDGTAKTPEVTVTLNGATLTQGTDYEVTYSDNTNPGTATVTVTGLNGYSTYNATKTFAIGADAKIGDTYYTTLAEAVTAANEMEGDVTITLLQDTTFSEMMTVSGDITIDGEGYTLSRFDDETDNSLDYTGALFTVENGASLTLNDLTIDGMHEWTFDEEKYTEVVIEDSTKYEPSVYLTLEDGAPIAKVPTITVNGSLTLNDTTIINNVGGATGGLTSVGLGSNRGEASVIYGSDSSYITLNNTAITHCANADVFMGSIIYTTGEELIINEGTQISGNFAFGDGMIAMYDSGTITMNGGEITDNRGCDCSGTAIAIRGINGSGDKVTFIMNGGKISGNVGTNGTQGYNRNTAIHIGANSEMIMIGGEVSENWGFNAAVDVDTATSSAKIYGGSVVNNIATSSMKDVSKGKGTATLYGGEYSTNITNYCAPGYYVYNADVDGDGNVDLYKVIKLMNIEFEDVTPEGTEGEKLYNINLIASEGDEINRLNSVDLTFAFDKDSDMAYEIIAPENGEIEINNVDGDRYEFHYKGKDGSTTHTGEKITIGQVKFTGFGKFTFGVDETADTNTAHTTKLEDNIVDSFIAVNGLTGELEASKSYLNIENKIEDEILVPLKNLKVNITFPNKVEYNAAAYQNMKLTVTGGAVDKEILLGDTAVDETLDEEIVNPAVVTLVENYFENGYSVSLNLPYNTTYTVAVEGEGYRTARYSVTLSEDKVLNFWNNVKDNAVEIEEGLTSSAVKHNFVAGDIIDDNSINIYDLSAVISYFATENDVSTASDYAKYDLDRNGVIDSKDVAYILVSWGN